MKKILEKVERVARNLNADYESADFLSVVYGKGSHGKEHILTVMRNVEDIMKSGVKVIYPKEIVVAAMLHDVTRDVDDESHETTAKLFIEELMKRVPDFKREMNGINMERVYKIIAEHRASYSGNYSSVEAEILATADRGFESLNERIERSMKYAEERGIENPILHALNHMVEKFGRCGYQKYPQLYMFIYRAELENMWNKIDQIKEMLEYTKREGLNINSVSIMGDKCIFTINGSIYTAVEELEAVKELNDMFISEVAANRDSFEKRRAEAQQKFDDFFKDSRFNKESISDELDAMLDLIKF